jgi:hypothetical protein
MAVIRFDQVSAPVQQQHATAPVGPVGQTLANVGHQMSRDLAGLAASMFRSEALNNATQKAMNDAGAVKDADDAYFRALEDIASYKRDVADGIKDTRGFFHDVLSPEGGIIAKAISDATARHGSRPAETQAADVFQKQIINRFHPLKEKLLTEWVQETVKQTKDGIDAATTQFSTNGTMLETPWGTPYGVEDLVNDYLGLRDRVHAAVRSGVLSLGEGTKHLQDTLVSTVLARQSRIYREDPLHADSRVAAEMEKITPLLDATHQNGLDEARRKGELNAKGEIERQLQRNLELGIMPIDQALLVAKDYGLDPKNLYGAQVDGMRARNEIADLAFKENDRFAEQRSKTLADAYELRILNEPGFSFASEMADRSKFYQMREEERKRVFAFQSAFRESLDTVKSDPATFERILALAYEDPEQVRDAVLGTVGKTLSPQDAKELLKLRSSHLEKLKDKRTADTHAQYVAAIHDLDDALKTVGGGSTETDPVALEVKRRYVQILRELMFDPDNTNTVGPELQHHLDWLKKQAIEDLKRKAASEGSQIIRKYRIFDSEGKASYAKVAELRSENIISELEAKRAKDYIDIQAHEPGVVNRPIVKPKSDKNIGRKFERMVE